jgi:hypothetical protein
LPYVPDFLISSQANEEAEAEEVAHPIKEEVTSGKHPILEAVSPEVVCVQNRAPTTGAHSVKEIENPEAHHFQKNNAHPIQDDGNPEPRPVRDRVPTPGPPRVEDLKSLRSPPVREVTSHGTPPVKESASRQAQGQEAFLNFLSKKQVGPQVEDHEPKEERATPKGQSILERLVSAPTKGLGSGSFAQGVPRLDREHQEKKKEDLDEAESVGKFPGNLQGLPGKVHAAEKEPEKVKGSVSASERVQETLGLPGKVPATLGRVTLKPSTLEHPMLTAHPGKVLLKPATLVHSAKEPGHSKVGAPQEHHKELKKILNEPKSTKSDSDIEIIELDSSSEEDVEMVESGKRELGQIGIVQILIKLTISLTIYGIMLHL